ncbi:hypothetical protein [Streptomyces iconiensis]|uniref:Uncharacterized protein n=1 Tax=Streptomyces iconiensis TaxID=1384038 RepID=A0ABT6ZRB4_9ACTN|nr:hypothetical protein [Streptomyces iconiensis]MDJ1131319.1 hypothetical protein [Streptomyces iconiensis]
MRNYEGPALMVFEGVETEMMADLTVDRSGEQEEWGGTLEAQAGQDLEGLVEHTVMVRLPNGGESEALVGWGSKEGSARIIGNGAAPF